MTGPLISWAIGAVAALAGAAAMVDWGRRGGAAPSRRKQFGIVLLCLGWPAVLALAVLGILSDLAGFVIEVTKRPH